MTDRIVLAGMAFRARHGVEPWEKLEDQRFEVDVELLLDLASAGVADELARTIDYSVVYAIVRRVVESTSFDLIEGLAEAIAREVLDAEPRVDELVVRVRKPDVWLGGVLAYAGVEIRRDRSG